MQASVFTSDIGRPFADIVSMTGDLIQKSILVISIGEGGIT
jgi:hypothetical protein